MEPSPSFRVSHVTVVVQDSVRAHTHTHKGVGSVGDGARLHSDTPEVCLEKGIIMPDLKNVMIIFVPPINSPGTQNVEVFMFQCISLARVVNY